MPNSAASERQTPVRRRRLPSAGRADRLAGQSQFGAEGGAAGGEKKTSVRAERRSWRAEHAVDGDERGVAAVGQSGDGVDEMRGREGGRDRGLATTESSRTTREPRKVGNPETSTL